MPKSKAGSNLVQRILAKLGLAPAKPAKPAPRRTVNSSSRRPMGTGTATAAPPRPAAAAQTIKAGTVLRYPIKDSKGAVLAGAGTAVTARMLDLLERRSLRLELTATLEVAAGIKVGLEIPIKSKPLSIGRDENCNVRPTNPLVSKQHCTIWKEGMSLWVKDDGSTNGTLVNGTRISSSTELNDSDTLDIGNVKLLVHLFAAVKGDPRFAAAEDETILTERGGGLRPDAAAPTKAGFDKKDLEEFQRLMQEDKKTL